MFGAVLMFAMLPFLRRVCALFALIALAACTDANVLEDKPVDLGDFQLGHNIVVTEGMKQGPFSRKATEEEVQTAVVKAIDQRFGAKDGDRLYHLGLKVDDYALALPGVPLVFTPQSILVISANVWDDAKGVKLNEETKLITVFEGFSGSTLVGSGLTRRKPVQLATLSANAARAIERWLLENGEWFGIDPSLIPEPEEEDALAKLAAAKKTAAETAPEAN
jgi:hypothetical protein